MYFEWNLWRVSVDFYLEWFGRIFVFRVRFIEVVELSILLVSYGVLLEMIKVEIGFGFFY